MNIRFADISDVDKILAYDKHITRSELLYSIERSRVYIAEENGCFCGWMRYNLFWDNTPFMNMLYFTEPYRGRGFGGKMLEYWENEMRSAGYSAVMTSTQSDEYAQHFYVKHGYRAIGGFTPRSETYELIMEKKIK